MEWLAIGLGVAVFGLALELRRQRRRLDQMTVEMEVQRDTVDDMAQVAGQVHQRLGLPDAWDERDLADESK